MTPHSPTPWRVQSLTPESRAILDANGCYVSYSHDAWTTEEFGPNGVDAAYVVRCVNAHEALVAALEWALTYGSFEVSTDNPLHRNAHVDAIQALNSVKDSR